MLYKRRASHTHSDSSIIKNQQNTANRTISPGQEKQLGDVNPAQKAQEESSDEGEAGEEEEEDSEEELDQPYILEEIDRLDDEIQKLNNQLKIMSAAEEASKNESENEKSLTPSLLPDELLDDVKPRSLRLNYNFLSDKEIILQVLNENRQQVREFKKRQKERDNYLLSPEYKDKFPILDPSYVTNCFEVNPKMRPALVKHLRKRRALQLYRDVIIREEYDNLQVKWENKVKLLEKKTSKKELSASPSRSNLFDDGTTSRTFRRAGLPTDGIVRTEAEWQRTLKQLEAGSGDQEKELLERCAKEPDMEPKCACVYRDTNNLVLDPVAELKSFNHRVDLIWSDAEKDLFKRFKIGLIAL